MPAGPASRAGHVTTLPSGERTHECLPGRSCDDLPMPTALHRAFDWRGPDRLVLVHGFTQTLRSWDGLANTLAETFQVVRVDLPGHGGSGALEMTFTETAAAIGDAGGTATYVGYSMG